MLWTSRVYAVVSKVTDQDALWKKWIRSWIFRTSLVAEIREGQWHLNSGFLIFFYIMARFTDKKNVIHPKAAVWECSGVCSFRHVDCQKFLIRAIIKELWRLFSTESHCLIAECTHTEYRWRMCLVGWRLHSNHWQLHRNLPIRHVMHKPKNTLKMNVNQCVKINVYTPSSNMHYFHQRSQRVSLNGITRFRWGVFCGLFG